MARLRVMVIDDEGPARRKLCRLLVAEPDVEVIGECSNGAEAVEAIQRLRPELIFLDVQMPGLDGFGVLAELKLEPLPQVVFVTAHDEFALRAFEVHALDYLLKPFDPDRFSKVLTRARAQLQRNGPDELEAQMRKLLAELRREQPYLERLLIEQDGRAFFLLVARIRWVEAARNYVNVHADEAAYLLRGTLEGLAKKLDPAKFVRVNRSQLVNLDYIRELQPWFHGEYRILLTDGTELMWRRRYLDRSSELFLKQF
jgi:two-component system, LytTR family, response regulator